MERSSTPPFWAQSAIKRDDGKLDELAGKLRKEPLDDTSSVYPLPNEILLGIVECFELPAQDVIATLPPQEFLVHRKTLYSLCLTSRLFNKFATPLLYQKLVFFLCPRKDNNIFLGLAFGNLRYLILLIRTLLWKHEYCKYIESIICPAGLGGRSAGAGEDIQYNETPTKHTRFKLLEYLMYQALKKGRYAILPRLSTLQIQQLDYSTVFPELGTEIATELLEIGNFHRLHVSRDIGYIAFPEGRKDSWMKRIKELKLVACVDAKALYLICESAARLESFSLIVSKPCDFYRPLPPRGKNINCALLKVADTLKALEIRTCQNTWFLGQFGPTRVLNCLPQLKKLETLAIEIPLLTGISMSIPSNKIFARLPPNLVSLEVVEMWWQSDTVVARGRDSLKKLLAGFVAELQTGLMPSLKRFQYVPSIIERCVDPEQLGMIKDLFTMSGVSFSYHTDRLPRRFFARQGVKQSKLDTV
ncbi:hypothetical protein F4774DRAFT_417293 [Daldinia eschscholtzii]|nr:hypothetical protein F4774DRAFT_417293 [Daldinia eschscholtzii]